MRIYVSEKLRLPDVCKSRNKIRLRRAIRVQKRRLECHGESQDENMTF